MQTFTVNWEIQIYAENALCAAERAIEIMRDRESLATVFQVTAENGDSEQIDLLAERDAI